jgi:DNA-binding IclR family transcriptional regulator
MTTTNEQEKTPKAPNQSIDVQSISRAAAILEAIGESSKGISLSQIALITGLSRSTVHRIVVALSRQEFVRTARDGYKLGPALLRLASLNRSSFEIDAHPFLVQLSLELRETVDLSAMTGQTITFVDQVIAQRRLRAVSGIGTTFPLYCTAPGKAILAAMEPSAAKALLPAHLERLTPSTPTTWSALEEEFETIRKTGIAFDREEHTLGICAVGKAIRTKNDHWFAVSVPLPSQRFYEQEQRLAEALTKSVESIIDATEASG